MDLKRFLISTPIAFFLTFGLMMEPGPQSSAHVVGDAPLMAFAVVDYAAIDFDSGIPEETPPPPTPTLAPTPTPTRVVTPTPTRRSIRVPILMYHYISVPPPDADKYRLDLSVTPANFQAHVEYLLAEGYHPITVADLTDYLRRGKTLPPNPIVLTFDDGYVDNYENAFPILKEYQIPATFFVITDFVDNAKPGYMTWNQLEEMAIEGMEIGSHTMSHPDLEGKSRTIQASEIAGSKATIEARIGTPVKSFCYPAGKYDSRTLDVLRSVGYHTAVTTEPQGTRQSSDAIFELRRIRVRGTYTADDLGRWIKYYLASGK
jgi:peptidoglycan/xylan/chitin deacetylase (PgdA/CDA1 family)